jgi:hypothetical protein
MQKALKFIVPAIVTIVILGVGGNAFITSNIPPIRRSVPRAMR